MSFFYSRTDAPFTAGAYTQDGAITAQYPGVTLTPTETGGEYAVVREINGNIWFFTNCDINKTTGLITQSNGALTSYGLSLSGGVVTSYTQSAGAAPWNISTGWASSYVLAGSAGGPFIDETNSSQTKSGSLVLGTNLTVNGATNLATLVLSSYFTPGAGGTYGNANIYGGSGTPAFNAPNGSLYLNYSGSSTTCLYVNTSGSGVSGTVWNTIGGAATTGTGTTFPTGIAIGTLFFRTDLNAVFTYGGATAGWTQVGVAGSATAPASPVTGQLAMVGTTAPYTFEYYNGTAWDTVVDTASAQTITGIKTFSSSTTTGELLIGGSSSSVELDWQISHSGALTLTFPATSQGLYASGYVAAIASSVTAPAGYNNVGYLTSTHTASTGAIIFGGTSTSSSLDFGVTNTGAFTFAAALYLSGSSLLAGGSVTAGSGTAPGPVGGSLVSSNGTSSGRLYLGGTTANSVIDFGATTAGVLTFTTPAGDSFQFRNNTTVTVQIASTGGIIPGASSAVGTAGLYSGTGAPSFSAPNGSVYIRYDGTPGTNVFYTNTSGASTSGTTWTAHF